MKAQIGTIILSDGTWSSWNKAWELPPGARPVGAAAHAAYDAQRRGLAYDEQPTSPNSGVPMGKRAEDDDEPDEGEHPAYEVMRRARNSLRTVECTQLLSLLGKLLMAEQEAEEDDDDELADGRTGTPDAGADARRAARDEPAPFSGRPRPGGEVDPIRERAQDAAYLAYDAKRRRKIAIDAASAADFAARHPEVARVGVISIGDAPPARIAYDATAAADFAERHPEVARIRCM